MNNLFMCVLYASLAGLSIILLVLSWAKHAQDSLDTSFRFMVLMLFVWQLTRALYFSSTSKAISLYLYDLDLPFVAFATLGWMLYLVQFYGLGSYFPPVVRLGLCVIPLFTLVLALTTPWHNFLRTEIYMLATTPMHVVQAVRGPWFWYHTAYCYAFVMGGLALAILQHHKMGRVYRRSSALLLLLGTFITLLGNLLVLRLQVDVDFSLICISLASLVMYVVTKNIQGLGFYQAARQEVFHYIDRGIFVVDAEGGIVSMNQAASEMVTQFSGIPVKTIHDALEMFAMQTTRKHELEGPSDGVDYYLEAGEVYNIYTKPFLDKRGQFMGSITAVTDVKENRRVIEYLDAANGMDALTGLANRRTFQESLLLLDAPEHLPLTLMVGDLNALKVVNDQLGHPQGDIYIRVAAGLLKATAPPSARIARTGGDEFILLLPNYTPAAAETLAQEIHSAFAELSGYAFKPSIALGHATKDAPDQDIAALLKQADEAMYQSKNHHKQANTLAVE